MIALAAVVSSPPMASRTDAVFEAFGMTSKVASLSHQMMQSSTTDPDSSSRCVYCARPGPILERSFVKVSCRSS